MQLKRLARVLRVHLRTGGRAVADLRNVVILALTIILVLAAHFHLYAYPSLVDVLIEESEHDAVRSVGVLQLIALGGRSVDELPTASTAATLDAVRKLLDVHKIKIFNHDGRVLYSSDSTEVGKVNTNRYFREIVAQGRTHVHLASSAVPTLDGERHDRHVVEVYVPIMGEGGFEGAFEIYYDITERHQDLDARLGTINFNHAVLLAILLITFAVIVARSYTAALWRERAHSRRLNDEIAIRLGIEEELRESHGHFRHLAHHDALTTLPNRTLFLDRFEHALANAARYRTGLALLFIDLNDFKPINDTYGHEAGDRILVSAAAILQDGIRECDTAARIAGDEFAVLIEHAELNAVDALAARLTDAFGTPRDLGFGEVTISASIGISIYPRDGTDMATLLHHADLAMYQAKADKGGQGRWRYYSDPDDALASG